MAGVVGRSFLLPNPNNPILHLCIVVCVASEGDEEGDDILVVPITSIDNHPDRTVVLSVGDHPFITKDCIAFFREAIIVSRQGLLSAGHTAHADADSALVSRLRQGLMISRYTPRMVKLWMLKHCAVKVDFSG